MKTIVISLGGSVLIPSIESHNIKKFIEILKEIAKKYRLFIVVGGGGEARRYIMAARDLGIDEANSDDIGIMVTQLNAALVAGALGSIAYPRIAKNYIQAREFAESGKIVVMGGVVAGQTTDAVSALLAEYVGADGLFNVTSVDGIYSRDPRHDKGATRYSHLTPKDLFDVVRNNQLQAGSNTVFDIVAAKVIERSNIPLFVLDGRDPENVRKAIIGGHFSGTVVCTGRAKSLPL